MHRNDDKIDVTIGAELVKLGQQEMWNSVAWCIPRCNGYKTTDYFIQKKLKYKLELSKRE